MLGRVTLVVFLWLALSGCERPLSDTHGKPVIVATIWPLASLAQQLTGDAAEVVCLVRPGASPHGFEPTAQQIEASRNARLVIAVGMNFDHWVHKLAAHHDHDHESDEAHFLEFSHVVGLTSNEGDHADEHAAHTGVGDPHAHTGPNPHLWLDPVLTMIFVDELAEHLTKVLPEAESGIAERLAVLKSELETLDAEYRAALEPLNKPRIVTFHNAFDRLAARYDVEVVTTLTPVESPSSLTLARIERVIEAVEKGGVKAVFAEPQFPPDAGRVIQQQTGIEVFTLDPIGNPHQPDRNTYQQMMRYNLGVLLQGLNQP